MSSKKLKKFNAWVPDKLHRYFFAVMELQDDNATHNVKQHMRKVVDHAMQAHPEAVERIYQRMLEEEAKARATAQTIDDLPQRHDDSDALIPIGKQTQG